MNKFMEEYVNGKAVQNNEKKLKKQLHNSKELAKSCTDRNNSRNRDIYSRAKSMGLMTDLEEVKQIEKKLEGFDDLDNSEDRSRDSSGSSEDL